MSGRQRAPTRPFAALTKCMFVFCIYTGIFRYFCIIRAPFPEDSSILF
jgi:hypothetical protein